ncbi:MAG: hypothetical protein KatS3mg032_0126 [Cyclobacteriaceae bacterium]|nr:MAG: hypothetical protein KatS3mg032_0126 [Cyclobacteriaceae bacterium]
MIAELQRLSEEERGLVYTAPLLVSILIAGADGSVDKKEIKKGLQAAERKSRSASPPVAALFKEVSTDFEDKLKLLMHEYPHESVQRNPLIAENLSKLNVVLRKLDQSFSVEFYKSLLLLAESIAKASGGFFGLQKVSGEEKKYVSLPMLQNPAAS